MTPPMTAPALPRGPRAAGWSCAACWRSCGTATARPSRSGQLHGPGRVRHAACHACSHASGMHVRVAAADLACCCCRAAASADAENEAGGHAGALFGAPTSSAASFCVLAASLAWALRPLSPACCLRCLLRLPAACCLRARQAPLLALFQKHKDSKGKQAKLKSPGQLQELLDVVRGLLAEMEAGPVGGSAAGTGGSGGGRGGGSSSGGAAPGSEEERQAELVRRLHSGCRTCAMHAVAAARGQHCRSLLRSHLIACCRCCMLPAPHTLRTVARGTA